MKMNGLRLEKNKEPACCFYNNNPENKERYGVLYNWYAVTDKKRLGSKRMAYCNFRRMGRG